MNIQEGTKNIKHDVDVALLHSEELNSVEKMRPPRQTSS